MHTNAHVFKKLGFATTIQEYFAEHYKKYFAEHYTSMACRTHWIQQSFQRINKITVGITVAALITQRINNEKKNPQYMQKQSNF